MKSLKVLTTRNEINTWLENQWQTLEFKTAHNTTNSFLKPLIEKFCEHPRFIIEMSNEYLERAHFTPWFNILTLRSYENPYIHDLFLLHEIYHMTSLSYKIDNFSDWSDKMSENEMITSIFTEVEIYDLLPIREKSFNEVIWRDLLPKDYTHKDLITWRKKAMIQPQNNIEQVIKQYGINNLKWADIWQKNYLNVETHMIEFYKLSPNKAEQIKHHLLWIQNNQIDNIVFKSEAEQFAPIYWQK